MSHTGHNAWPFPLKGSTSAPLHISLFTDRCQNLLPNLISRWKTNSGSSSLRTMRKKPGCRWSQDCVTSRQIISLLPPIGCIDLTHTPISASNQICILYSSRDASSPNKLFHAQPIRYFSPRFPIFFFPSFSLFFLCCLSYGLTLSFNSILILFFGHPGIAVEFVSVESDRNCVGKKM